MSPEVALLTEIRDLLLKLEERTRPVVISEEEYKNSLAVAMAEQRHRDNQRDALAELTRRLRGT